MQVKPFGAPPVSINSAAVDDSRRLDQTVAGPTVPVQSEAVINTAPALNRLPDDVLLLIITACGETLCAQAP